MPQFKFITNNCKNFDHEDSLFINAKEQSDKVGLILNTEKTKIMVSIILWQIDGETEETVADFILGGSKITADCDCSHDIKNAYSLEGKL